MGVQPHTCNHKVFPILFISANICHISFLNFILLHYLLLLLAAWGLHRSSGACSGPVSGDPLSRSVCGLLIVTASLVAEHGLEGAWA